MNKSAGFTLLEVMVALAICAMGRYCRNAGNR